MTQCGEGCLVTKPIKVEEVEEIERIPKTVRIALFFDGTLNNRNNIEAREKETEDYKEHHDNDGGDSYDNGRTNIAILETHVDTEVENSYYDFFEKDYISGQGTFDLKEDSFKGKVFAIGGSGVPSRAKSGFQAVENIVKNLEEFDKYSWSINKLTIDVYGFSRGAATARYAIHLLLKDDSKKLRQKLANHGVVIEEGKDVIEVGFAGLYDTVLSYLGSQMSKSANNRLEQKAISLAKSVIHIAAAEEHRENFPLHNIKGAKSGKEFYLPGVHSDIGGSYNNASELALEQQEAAGISEENIKYSTKNKEQFCLNKGSLDEVLADKSYLVEQGWYRNERPAQSIAGNEQQIKDFLDNQQGNEYKRVKEDGEFILKFYYKPNRIRGGGGRIVGPRRGGDWPLKHVELWANRHHIHSAYSSIPLKIMADFAVKETKILFVKELTVRADKIIKQSKLGAMETFLTDYVAKNNSSANDWLNDRSEKLKFLRNKHLNFSSKFELGLKPNLSNGKRKRFIYDA